MQRCPNCMQEMRDGRCPCCGYPEDTNNRYRNALPIGKVLNNRFELGLARGAGFQSLVYIAWDREMNRPVLVTELFPQNQALRKNGLAVAKRTPELFENACNLYTESRQQMPLTMLTSFRENQTAYRVYELPGNDGSEAEEPVEQLCVSPVYFRDAFGKPVMNVCALEIPPMPGKRQWKPGEEKTGLKTVTITTPLKDRNEKDGPVNDSPETEGRKKEKSKRSAGTTRSAEAIQKNTAAKQPKHAKSGRKKTIVCLCCVVLVAVIGVIAFSFFRRYPVQIEFGSKTAITEARFGDYLLPEATPDENGRITYTVDVRYGKYDLTASSANGMSLSEKNIEVTGQDRILKYEMPDPTATPVPEIRLSEGEWIFRKGDEDLLLVTKDGAEPVVGIPNEKPAYYTVTLTGTEEDGAEGPEFSVAGDAGQMSVAWVGGENGKEFSFAAAGADLHLAVRSRNGNWMPVASLEKENSLSVDAEAIRFWREHLDDPENACQIVFVGENNSQALKDLTWENLKIWSERYPDLFRDLPVREYLPEPDPRFSGEAEFRIEGMTWLPGQTVHMAGKMKNLETEISFGDAVFHEPAETEDTGITIGRETADTIAEQWKFFTEIVNYDGRILPKCGDGQLDEGKAEELGTLMALCPGAFSFRAEDLKEKKLVLYATDIHLEHVSAVYADGLLLNGIQDQDEYTCPVSVTGGNAVIRVCFDNGYEVEEKVSLEKNERNVHVLLDTAMKKAMILEEILSHVKGIVRLGENQEFFVMNDDRILRQYSLADVRVTVKELKQLLEVFVVDRDTAIFDLCAVELKPDERLRKDLLSGVKLERLVFHADAAGNYPVSLTPGRYRIRMTADGKGIMQTIEVTGTGGSGTVLLKDLADAAEKEILARNQCDQPEWLPGVTEVTVEVEEVSDSQRTVQGKTASPLDPDYIRKLTKKKQDERKQMSVFMTELQDPLKRLTILMPEMMKDAAGTAPEKHADGSTDPENNGDEFQGEPENEFAQN